MLRLPIFWIGFAVSFFVVLWNAAGTAGYHAGLNNIALGMPPWTFDALAEGTPFAALIHGTAFLIIFTAVGIAFLLPKEITFSVWFYFLLSRAYIMVEAHLGHIRDQTDMQADWLWHTNPLAAQGSGGILLFAAVTLFRGVKGYAARARGQPLVEWVRLCLPIVGLGAGVAIVTAWLAWNHIPVTCGLAVVLFITLMTLGLMRIVAEGGIYWFQSQGSFFHIYKILAMGRAFVPALLAPLLPIYGLFFLDYKTFLAPNLANAAAMEKKVGGRRDRFHLSMVLALLTSVLASLVCSIYVAHWRGAKNMQLWFYTTGPQRLFDWTRDTARLVPSFDVQTAAWYLFGALWVGLSLWLRRTLFWFPHPIGYVMLMNPLMNCLWFSFFLGWVCKRTVVRYGGKQTYDRTRGFFVGLIMGELIGIACGIGFSLMTGMSVQGIDLNRYS